MKKFKQVILDTATRRKAMVENPDKFKDEFTRLFFAYVETDKNIDNLHYLMSSAAPCETVEEAKVRRENTKRLISEIKQEEKKLDDITLEFNNKFAKVACRPVRLDQLARYGNIGPEYAYQVFLDRYL